MKSSKLIELMGQLSPNELNLAQDVVHSPCFNKHEDVMRLMDILASAYPEFPRERLYKDLVWNQLYPDLEYNDLRLRHLSSLLLALLEKSLVLPEVTSGWHFEQSLMEAYSTKGLFKHFKTSLRRQAKTHQSAKLSPQLHYQAFSFGLAKGTFPGTPEEETQRIAAVNTDLDHFFVAAKLRQACILQSRRQFIPEATDSPLFDALLDSLSRNPPQDPVIQLYHLAYQFQDKDDDQLFQRFQALLQQFMESLESHIGAELNILGRNYCIRRANQGNPSFLKSLLDLYQQARSHNLLLDATGNFSPSAFKNMVTTGLRLQEYDFTEKLIQELVPQLPEDQQDNYGGFAMGRLYFERGEFRNAVRSLRKVRLHQLYLSLDSRVLLLKSWYHLQEFELAESEANSMRNLIHRKKVIGYQKANYLNFLKLFKQLIERAPSSDQKKLLRKKIDEMEPLSERRWLVEQL